VALVGHTDPRGTEEYNLALSEQRARSVKDYLTPLVGAAGSKLHVVPKGMLEATGTDDASWSRDRRVDFQWE
jgi:peptidoglycan-associated lipoprotein